MNRQKYKGRRYINLVRCSKETQADTSPVDQLRLQNAYGVGLEMIHAGNDFILEGITGSVPAARTDIERIVHRKKMFDDFDVLLVQDVSRFTRGGIDHGGKLKWDLGEVGIEVIFVTQESTGDPDQDALIQSVGFYAAQQMAKSLSYAATRGQMSALAAGTVPHACRIPFGIDRLFVGADGKSRHRIRNLPDGTQQMLHPENDTVLATYGRNPKKGASLHYRRQSDEKILLVPGSVRDMDIVRQIYRRKLVEGRGAYLIAKELNDNGVPSATGKLWNTDSITSILTNSTYTGVGIAGRYATGIYHVHGGVEKAAPKAVDRDMRSIAMRKKSQKSYRPRDEWFWQPHPFLVNYLGDDLREMALALHEKEFAKQDQKAAAPKVHLKANRDKHGDSPYLLKDLLVSKQGNRRMRGALSGPPGDQRRYYRLSKSVSTPVQGSVLRRMIPAEQLEQAILKVVKEMLLDTSDLASRIEKAVKQAREAVVDDREKLEPLKRERDELTAQVLVTLELGEATRRAMKEKFTQWESRLAALEVRIQKAETPRQEQNPHRLDETVKAVQGRLSRMAETMDGMPSAALRKLLGTVITRLEVDLETKEVEMEMVVPEEIVAALEKADGGAGALCLVGAKPWPSRNETQWAETLKIGVARCESFREGKKPCFVCLRKAA